MRKQNYDIWWSTVPVLAGGLLILLIWLADLNQTLFLTMNHWYFSGGDIVWGNLTQLGDSAVALVLLLVVIRQRPDWVGWVLQASIIALVFVHGLKPLINIDRPVEVLGQSSVHVIGPVLRHYAFPSGHTTTVFVLGASLVFVIKKQWVRGLIFCLACCVGVSRIMVGAHWPVDVLAGMIGGWSSVVIAGKYGLTERIRWSQKVKNYLLWIATLLLLTLALWLLFWRDYSGDHPATLLPRVVAAAAIAGWGIGWAVDRFLRQPSRKGIPE